jgi:hypothetical protein
MNLVVSLTISFVFVLVVAFGLSLLGIVLLFLAEICKATLLSIIFSHFLVVDLFYCDRFRSRDIVRMNSCAILWTQSNMRIQEDYEKTVNGWKRKSGFGP